MIIASLFPLAKIVYDKYKKSEKLNRKSSKNNEDSMAISSDEVATKRAMMIKLKYRIVIVKAQIKA